MILTAFKNLKKACLILKMLLTNFCILLLLKLEPQFTRKKNHVIIYFSFVSNQSISFILIYNNNILILYLLRLPKSKQLQSIILWPN